MSARLLSPAVLRSVLLFLLGMFAFVWQVIGAKADRPALLGATLLLLGFPLAQLVDYLRVPGVKTAPAQPAPTPPAKTDL